MFSYRYEQLLLWGGGAVKYTFISEINQFKIDYNKVFF